MRRDRSARYVSNDGARGEECPKTTTTPRPLPDRGQRPLGPLPIVEAQNFGTPSSDDMGIEQIVPAPSFTALARSHIVEVLPDCRFLPVITAGNTVTVSCQSGHRIWKAQDKFPVYAYQYLRSKVLDRWDPATLPRRPGPGLRME